MAGGLKPKPMVPFVQGSTIGATDLESPMFGISEEAVSVVDDVVFLASCFGFLVGFLRLATRRCSVSIHSIFLADGVRTRLLVRRQGVELF